MSWGTGGRGGRVLYGRLVRRNRVLLVSGDSSTGHPGSLGPGPIPRRSRRTRSLVVDPEGSVPVADGPGGPGWVSGWEVVLGYESESLFKGEGKARPPSVRSKGKVCRVPSQVPSLLFPPLPTPRAVSPRAPSSPTCDGRWVLWWLERKRVSGRLRPRPEPPVSRVSRPRVFLGREVLSPRS